MARPVLTPLDGDGIIDTDELVDLAVTAAKLATDAVETAKILNDAVATAKLNDGAVTAAKLAADAVETAKILNAAVTAAKLATDSVTNTKIATAAVDTDEIATDAVTTAKIADDAVTEAKIADAVLSSSWTTPTLASGWSGGSVKYKKVGNVVYVVANNVSRTGSSETSSTLFTLPAGFRPSTTWNGWGRKGTTVDGVWMSVTSAGVVSVGSTNGQVSAGNLPFPLA